LSPMEEPDVGVGVRVGVACRRHSHSEGVTHIRFLRGLED
jgi:hypothetical protein